MKKYMVIVVDGYDEIEIEVEAENPSDADAQAMKQNNYRGYVSLVEEM